MPNQAVRLATVENAARTVPIRLGPNAIKIAQQGGSVLLSGTEAGELARVALMALDALDAEDTGSRRAADEIVRAIEQASLSEINDAFQRLGWDFWAGVGISQERHDV
ncbi:hypothetical protein ACFVGM_09090 [Kitasatospora purpeofusca]|uniref:hypothetical protein n=1 Tax=Kitasatospora purpeofusca TaxID=67352 RepID=UPI0036C63ACA